MRLEEMRGTTLQSGGGEFGSISSAAIHAGTQGKLGYRLSIGQDQNAQWRNSDALAYRSNKFNVQTEYALPGRSKLSLSGGVVDANRYDGPIFGAATTASTITQSYAYASYDRPNFFLRGWWNELSATSLQSFGPVSDLISITSADGTPRLITKGNSYNIEAQHALDFGSGNRLTYGTNYRLNTLSGTFVTALKEEHRLGLFLQDEWRATTNLTFVAGVRYDLDTFINPTFSPRIAVLYEPIKDHTFRATVSVAYRPPTLLETHIVQQQQLNLPPPLPSPASIPVRGGSNLVPEQMVSYELGYQGWFFKHSIRARANLFINHISDLIGVSDFGSSITFFNGKNADIYGGEAGVEFLVTRWLSGFANYAYQEVSQTFTGDLQRSAPRSKVNAGLRAEWDNGITGEATFHQYGAVTYPISGAFGALAPFGVQQPNPRVGSYNLLNMRAGYRFWQQKAAAGYMRDAEVAVSVFNALNDEHKEHPLGDLIGRRVMGWLTVRF
jgi:iron complex outermembrane receptor protein